MRTLQEKKNAQAKASRRDIALLLEKGRIETARIKVENSKSAVRDSDSILTCHCIYCTRITVINEDIYVELLELLELYCELLIARFGVLDQLYAHFHSIFQRHRVLYTDEYFTSPAHENLIRVWQRELTQSFMPRPELSSKVTYTLHFFERRSA